MLLRLGCNCRGTFLDLLKKYYILWCDFLSRTVKKLLTIYFSFRFFYSALNKEMCKSTVLDICLMFQELIAIKTVQYLLFLVKYILDQMWQKPWKFMKIY